MTAVMRRRDLLLLLALATPNRVAAGESNKKRIAGPNYIPIDTLTGATLKPSGRRGVLTVDCGLDVPDATLRARAEALLPRLRAALVQTVTTYAAGLPPGAPPSVDFLAISLQRDIDTVLGRPGARILLGSILVT